MSNYFLVEKTKNRLERSDMLIASSIIGSFVFLAFKNIQSDSIKIFHKKTKNDKNNEKKEFAEDEYLSNKNKKSTSLEKYKKNKKSQGNSKYLVNSLNFAGFNEKIKQNSNFKNSFHNNFDNSHFLNREKKLRIETPIFTYDELEELKKIVIDGENQKRMIKEEGDNVNEEDNVWQIEEHQTENFDLEKIYNKMIDNQPISSRKSFKNLNTEEFQGEFEESKKNVRSEKSKQNKKINFEDENYIRKDSIFSDDNLKKTLNSERNKKSANLLEMSLNSIDISKYSFNLSKKFDKYFKNPFNLHESPIICKAVAQERQDLISSLNFNVVLDIRDKFYMLGSIKILMKLKEVISDRFFFFF